MDADDFIGTNSNIDDDPIVKEIPILHSTRLQERLYCLKYGFLPKHFANEVPIKKGFFKPQNREMKLEVAIDVESPHFDRDVAEITAEEVDGPPESRKTNNINFEDDLVDKVFLRSTKPIRTPSKYAALAYNGKEVHLTTLDGIFQFRPTFDYLEKGKKRKKDFDRASDGSDDEQAAGPSNVEQITVRFKQQQHDDQAKSKKSHSFKALEAKSAEEPWMECNIHPESSTLSTIEKLKLFSETSEETGQASNLSNSEYLRVLIPEDQELATVEPSLPSHIMSLHALRAKPVLEQCRLLLKVAKIIQFNQLLMTLTGGEGFTPDILLKTLPKVAVLVRGNWVVKSEVLYPNNTFSATSGVPAELMVRARDYVLYLFTKNQYVERKTVSSVMQIPSEEVSEIFTGFSKLSHNKGWELLLPIDTDFMLKHSDIVLKQIEAWEQRFKQLSEFLRDNKRQRRKSKSVSDDSKVNKNGPCFSSDNDSGTEKKSPVASRKNKVMKFKDSTED